MPIPEIDFDANCLRSFSVIVLVIPTALAVKPGTSAASSFDFLFLVDLVVTFEGFNVGTFMGIIGVVVGSVRGIGLPTGGLVGLARRGIVLVLGL